MERRGCQTPTKRTRPMDDVLSFAQVGLDLPLYDWQLEIDEAIDMGSSHERIKIALGRSQRFRQNRACRCRQHSALAEPFPPRPSDRYLG